MGHHRVVGLLSALWRKRFSDEGSSLHGQTKQYDTKRGQQLVRGRPVADARHHTKVRDG